MNKVAFEIGGLTIHWYGVLVALGFLAGLWTASRRAPRDGLSSESIVDIGPWLIVGGLIGARLNYVISYWDEFFANGPFIEVFMIHHGGLVFYGGLIGATLAGCFYARLKKLPLWKLADTLAPSVALGHVFGRAGCLMNGCCWGKETDLPWHIHFPEHHETLGKAVHPTQIYESGLNLILYGGLAWLYRNKRFDGQVFGVYLIAYAILRSLVEALRGDYAYYNSVGWATPGQMVSVVMAIAGGLILWKFGRQGKSSGKAGGGL